MSMRPQSNPMQNWEDRPMTSTITLLRLRGAAIPPWPTPLSIHPGTPTPCWPTSRPRNNPHRPLKSLGSNEAEISTMVVLRQNPWDTTTIPCNSRRPCPCAVDRPVLRATVTNTIVLPITNGIETRTLCRHPYLVLLPIWIGTETGISFIRMRTAIMVIECKKISLEDSVHP